ncbi:MAG: dihydroneopterin aldolase [Arsenophonus sp. ET-YP4-MAG3]
MDIVFIKKLSVFTIIGAYKWEQTIKQEILLDIEMGWNNRRAAKKDQIEYCLDYDKVSQVIIKYIETQKFVLIERIAQEVADIILNQFNSFWVRVKVCKPGVVINAKQIGVIVERIKSTLD